MRPAGMATAAAAPQQEQPGDEDTLSATLSHKSQQRRVQKLAKHKPRGKTFQRLDAAFQ